MQTMDAKPWLGKRVRMSAWIKSGDIFWASVWMRVDAESIPLRFDNMEGRGLEREANWHRVDVVLDVPFEAKTIAFGALLHGKSQIWVDDFEFHVVEGNVKETNVFTLEEMAKRTPRLRVPDPVDADDRRPISTTRSAPINLGFED
jgi:AraC family transcriptional regulator